MPSHPERSLRRLAALGLFAVLLMLAAIPAYLAMDPSWRAVAVRVGSAVIVVAGCVRTRRFVTRSMEGQSPSALDAPPFVSPAPELDARFIRLREDLVLSARSRRYFDAVLWPRLLELAGGNLDRPPERPGIRRRGPPLSALATLIAEVEKRT